MDMKIAYLISAHNTPKHFVRLVDALDSPNCAFFVHIDKKSNIENFFISRENVHFSKHRFSLSYVSFTIVEATLILLEEAINHSSNFDYFVLLSGSDYPLQSARYIEEFFDKNQGKEFINTIQMPNEISGKPISRLLYYKSDNNDPKMVQSFLKLLSRYGIRIKRNYKKHLGNLTPYGGSAWWALSRPACTFILDYINQHLDFINFYKNTFHPCEMIFQTILMGSPFMRNQMRNITFTDWTNGGQHPATLQQQHIEFFKNSDKIIIEDHYGKGEVLFARKFSDESENLIKQLNEIIHTKEKQRMESPRS